MCSGKPQVLPQEMNQQQSRLHFCRMLDSVDFHPDSNLCHHLCPFLCAIDCPVERSACQHSNDVSFVFYRTADIFDRIRLSRGELGRLFDHRIVEYLTYQESFGLFGLQRRESDIGQTDPRSPADATWIESNLCGYSGSRVVTDLSLEFQISAAARWRLDRNPDLLENLIRLECRGKKTGEETLDGNLTLTARADGKQRCSKREHSCRMVIGGIAVSQIATDGGLISYERVGNYQSRVHEYRKFCFECTGNLEVTFPNQGPNPQTAAIFSDVVETWYSVNVDDKLW